MEQDIVCMGLSSNDRGFLDQVIDRTTNDAKNTKSMFVDPQIKTAFQLKNPEEFVFGRAYGQIFQSFSSYFPTINKRLATEEELQEVSQVIIRRLPELRQAIFFDT